MGPVPEQITTTADVDEADDDASYIWELDPRPMRFVIVTNGDNVRAHF